MNTQQLIDKAYLLATGQVSELSTTDDDYTKLLAIANIFLLSWANEPGVNWNSLYDNGVDCGTITATDTFTLDSSIRVISNDPGDFIRIQDATDTDKYYNFTLIAPKDLDQHTTGNYCAKIGNQLKFNRTFEADDNEFGGTILVPAYTTPTALSAADDVVPVDDPHWLAYMAAAEYVRNDVTRAQNYPGLIALANQSMEAMQEANKPQTEKIYMRPAVPMPRRW